MNEARRAIEVLQMRGWTQGRMEDDDGRVCLGGAIGMAVRGRPPLLHVPACRLLTVVREVLSEMQPRTYTIAMFNDRPGRTLDEIVAVLEKAEMRMEELS